MQTFLITFIVVLLLGLALWLWLMLSNKPTFPNGKSNRFVANWKEGGGIVLLMVVASSFLVSLAIVKFILFLKVVDLVN